MTALVCVVVGVNYPSFMNNAMFGDSGSSCHIRNTLEGMFDTKAINEQIEGAGNDIPATRKGELGDGS